MKFGSVCSGIEAASVAAKPIGWKAAWLSEIEPFPCAVLKHHYPDIPNHGDMTLLPQKIMDEEVEAPEIFVGGTPCQAFSVAGARQGLADARGNLTLTFVEIANAIEFVRLSRNEAEPVIVWENVLGVLSSKDNAFGCFLGALAGEKCELQPPRGKWTNSGYVLGPQRQIAWRVFDAQFFGVAQRRKRVWVIASSRKDIDIREILFEFGSVRRDIKARSNSGEKTTADARKNAQNSSWWDGGQIAGTLTKQGAGGNQRMPDKANFGAVIEATYANGGDICNTVTSKWMKGSGGPAGSETGNMVMQPIAIQGNLIGQSENPFILFEPRSADGVPRIHGNLCPKLNCMGGGQRQPSIAMNFKVRRITPIECERLQGFPDNYTNIPWKKSKESPDGPRYKALGNSWAVPNAAWIFKRINEAINGNL